MASGVGNAYAILRGYATGDRKKAFNYLDKLSPTQLTLRNRAESRMRGRLRKRKHVFGQKPTQRRAV